MANRKIRILYIHHSAGWGGAAGCLITMIRSLDKSKYDPEVLLLRDSEISERLVEYGIKYKVAGSIFYKKYYKFFAHSEAGYIRWYNVFKFIWECSSWILSRYYFAGRELSGFDIDLIHLNSSVLTDWLKPSKDKGKVIIHIREPFRKGRIDILHSFFKNQIIKYSDKIIAISQDNADRIGISNKTAVVYDFCIITEEPVKEESYFSRKVLYLGGSSTSKGFYTLVEALDYLESPVKVYFGGKYVVTKIPGNVFKLVKFYLSKARKRNKAIEKIGNHPNAIVLGLIYNVQDYLREVSCLISPFSVPHFSFPVVESFCCKKAVIGSDVEGMSEIIEHEKNGLIVPVRDHLRLATSINELTSDSKRIKEFGENGYKIAVKNFSPSNIKLIENIYITLS